MEQITTAYLELLKLTETISLANKDNDLSRLDEVLAQRNNLYLEFTKANINYLNNVAEKEVISKIIASNEEVTASLLLQREDLIQQLKAMHLAKKCNKVYNAS